MSGTRVAVIGGGLAGLAAAVAARQQGLEVELFEARRHLGGRAGSFFDPDSGELVDHCQHVAMGCCTNLADFWRRTGVEGCFRRDCQLWFVGPEGAVRRFGSWSYLPSPLHLAPGMLGLKYLGLGERLRIVRTLLRLARGGENGDRTIGSWLRQQGESQRVLDRFWSVVLVSALGETLERASWAAARKVFIDGFLASQEAYALEVPRVPLGEIYDQRLTVWLAEHGVQLRLGAGVRKIEGDGSGAQSLVFSDGDQSSFDYLVLAVPWRSVARLLSHPLREALPRLSVVDSIQPAPITAVHLWLDRPIMSLPHAVLVGKLSQWVFRRERATRDGSGNPEHYYQVVISASHGLRGCNREEIVGRICGELAAVWPAMREARLLRWRMVTNTEAVFSVQPELDGKRPPQATEVPNLMLAGDWTDTGWPATMEGAVRSGYLAVEAILEALGRRSAILVPDLERGWLARRLLGSCD